ncbi:hypothetical protein BASA81_008588 [Batrachochytrium salamandrivorans]|nr:hypothetical protein BASA81_008588 [Batrachochytrium salamandrivorans]
MQVLGYLLLLAFGSAQALRYGEPEDPRALLLSSVNNLVFTEGRLTVSGGRTKPVPQLSCIKGEACGTEYEPTTVMCKNIGEDYNTGDPNWECTTSLQHGLRLGITDVVCEGYRSKTDKYVLKGSCALDYTLEGSVPGYQPRRHYQQQQHGEGGLNLWNWIFAFALLWVVGKWWLGAGRAGGGAERPMRPAPPPPQYSTAQPECAPNTDSSSYSGPGFWQGVGLGGLGGYLAGARNAAPRPSTTYSQRSYRPSPSPSSSPSTSYATTSRRG